MPAKTPDVIASLRVSILVKQNKIAATGPTLYAAYMIPFLNHEPVSSGKEKLLVILEKKS